MKLMEAIHGRRAVRSYTAEPVAPARLRALIDAAIQAPSAMNRQPWSFCVISDQSLLQRISDASKAHMLDTVIPDTAAGDLSEFRHALGDPGFHIFYHAPALIVISATEEGPRSRIDCALAAENMMLAACDAGLGSCWIGFAQAWLGTPDGKRTLDLPEAHVPIAPIIVGHPEAVPPAVPRNEPDIRWIGEPGTRGTSPS